MFNKDLTFLIKFIFIIVTNTFKDFFIRNRNYIFALKEIKKDYVQRRTEQ